jgi:hypothetical protein
MLALGFAMLVLGVLLGLAFAVIYGILVVIDRIKEREYRASRMPEVRALFAEWDASQSRPPAGRHRLAAQTNRHHLRRAA